ncbi:hypothetical protein A3770_09p56400 [Chloropicon primus]|uniref:Methyltransferase FkbM domain-containing protein n=1 Tax=Chloropicon primus TaxID=1764295 RepID=A0A5B8MUJ0_9CHLO|nr:hypothetical protein A3770_09p56400 [Chloropicon primus]|eukprot:QDZ23122.1 hypothetical protein A3770_09p56400 [Chloropicon primus]
MQKMPATTGARSVHLARVQATPRVQATTLPRGNGTHRLADGCHHVFLDVGANIGIHTRFLFEPSLYPDASLSTAIFESQFGSGRDNRDFCAFGFEPNPAHADRHRELEAMYGAMGWRYTPVLAAAGNKEGALTFYHNAKGAGSEEWGFSSSLHADPKDVIAEEVPVVHLARWIEREIMGRKLPARVYGKYEGDPGPKVVMKMDVEGQEYYLLPSLLATGVMCKGVDFVFGEHHARFFRSHQSGTDFDARGDLDRFDIDKQAWSWHTAYEKIFGDLKFKKYPKGELVVESEEDAWRIFDLLVTMMMSTTEEDCKTTFLMADDESYLHDGAPWPAP